MAPSPWDVFTLLLEEAWLPLVRSLSPCVFRAWLDVQSAPTLMLLLVTDPVWFAGSFALRMH